MKNKRQKRRQLPRFAIRTVKDGKVKILGNIYECPTEPDSGGRFEGKRYAFGLYWSMVSDNDSYAYQLDDHVEHWGTEAYYKSGDSQAYQDDILHMTQEDDKGQHMLYWASWMSRSTPAASAYPDVQCRCRGNRCTPSAGS